MSGTVVSVDASGERGPSTPRLYVVTGASSGIGEATAACLRRQGHRVIGVGRRGPDVVADLSTPSGRASLVHAVAALAGGAVDGVVACAGAAPSETLPAADTVRVNYFGVVATLVGLQPLLARSNAPRAVVVSSLALVRQTCAPLVDACLDGDEERAVRVARECASGTEVYASSKRAIVRWVRRMAASEAWAGAGITLNAVAPGVVVTPMTEPVLKEDARRGGRIRAGAATGLGGPWAAAQVAPLVAWMVGVENEMTTGQCVFMDGGVETVWRGDDVWHGERDAPSSAPAAPRRSRPTGDAPTCAGN